MTKEELKQYKEDKKIKFIYRLPCSLYNEGFEYIIVGNNIIVQGDNIRIFSLEDWFIRIKSGSLLPYVCSILSKSGKIKEYINIYEKPDIINLRKYIMEQFTLYSGEHTDNIKKELIQECLWGIQVIREFKVNRIDVFKEKINNPFKEFMIASTPIYKMWIENNE